MKTFFRFNFCILVAILCALQQVIADVPATLNYQGTLTDNTGQPVNGAKTITFSLYNSPSAGTAFWTETQIVTVTDGRLSVVLGSDPGNPLAPAQFTGETYIGIQIDPDTEMPRQKFASVAYAFNAGNAADAIPSGLIAMWSGSVANIPEGWALCDGNNGTPDLRDRFIVGAGDGYSSGNTGGVTTNNISHTHNISFNTANAGAHTHPVTGSTIGEPTGFDFSPRNRKASDEKYMGHHHSISGTAQSDGAHSHPVTGLTASSGSTSLENRPPYYALAFIMKL